MGGYNIKAGNINVIQFSSSDNKGEGALKDMHEWLHHPDNKDYIVIDIKKSCTRGANRWDHCAWFYYDVVYYK